MWFQHPQDALPTRHPQLSVISLRQLADNINQIFWLREPANWRIFYVSPAYERIWGRSGAALLADSREWLEGVHPDDRARVAQTGAKTANGENSDQEYRVVRPDGSERWVHSRGFPIRDAAGNIWRVAGLTEDITEKRKLESQLLRAQRTESLGTLASGIAHDLNNVLAPILLSVELLRMEMPPERRAALLATLETSAKRGAGMVKQVLMFARGVEGERVPLKPEQLLREIEHIIRETFPRTITIRTEVAADCSSVLGDLTQLQQALLNLCVNSRDAMADGGQLMLSAANLMLDEHFVATNPGARTGPHVVLQVSDTGSGIPASIMDRIFDPFFTTKEVGKGTGLGLSTLQAIVKSHGGFVSVYSEPRRGTTFKLYLPAVGEAASQPRAPANTDLPRGNGELVLIADDEEPIRNVARSTLEAFGYRVLVAADGAEAVALFAQYSDDIALLLTDMMMPIMDGPTTIAAIGHIRPGMRVIASSGLTSMRELARDVPSTVKYHLQKPYTADKLLRMVRQALQS